MIKNKISLIAIILAAAFQVKTIITDEYWKHNFVLKADGMSYYQYLPSALIEKDITLKFLDKNPSAKNRGMYMYIIMPGEINFNKYTCGVALLNLPFFTGAYLLAPAFNQPQDGYSEIFQLAVIIAGVFYSIAGLFFIRNILLRYYKDLFVALTLISILPGTNLFIYSISEPAMNHVYSFFLISLFLWLVIKWHNSPSYKFTILAGLVLGMIVLVRPIDILVVVLFLLYNVRGARDLNNHITYLEGRFRHLLILSVCMFIPFLPQFYYWKKLTGKWIYYSYGKEGFFFSHPHIADGMFSYRNGWLIYTPIMIFAVAGLFIIKKKSPEWSLSVPAFFVINTYVILSWWCWWYSGYGNRAFIDCYPVMAIPMAAMFSFIGENSKVRSSVVAVAAGLLIWLNIFQQWQYKVGILHWAAMNRDAYRAIFLKDYKPLGLDYILTEPDNANAIKYGREDVHQ